MTNASRQGPGGGGRRSRRDRAAAALAKPTARTLARRLPGWRGVVVLNYHRIGDPAAWPWDRTLWNAGAETFDAQLATLAREAEVIGPDELPALVRERRRGRRVLITFDDGYRDNWELAFPLLRARGLRATFFLATGFLDDPHAAWWDELAWMVRRAPRPSLDARPWLGRELALGPHEDATIAALVERYKALPAEEAQRFLAEMGEATGAGRCRAGEAAELWMTWEMAREMRDGGMRIGGHTVTHPVLARLPVADQEREIAGCAERLAAELGEPLRWFAYPVGARDTYTPETKRILREAGAELAFSFYGGYAPFSGWDPLDVPRLHVGPRHGPDLLRAILALPGRFARW